VLTNFQNIHIIQPALKFSYYILNKDNFFNITSYLSLTTKTMRNFIKLLTVVSLSTVMAFALSGCVEAPLTEDETQTGETETTETADDTASSGDEIVIGGIAPLTGDAAVYGKPTQIVSQIAVDKLNEAGGINGKTLRIIWEDGKCSGTDAANAIQKLINIDKVNAVYGGFCSSETLNAAPIAESSKVILFSCASSSPDVTSAGDFVFRNYPSDASQGAVLAKLADDLGYEKVGLITEDNDYTVGIDRVFTELFPGEVVSETYLPDDSDFRTQLVKLKGAGVDMIFINPQTAPKAELIIKQIQEANIELPLFANDVAIGTPDLIKNYGETVEGMISAEVMYEADDPEYIALTEEYTSRTGEEDMPWDSYASTCYDGIFVLAEAMNAAGGDADTEAIRDYLYGVEDRQGIAGMLSIDKNGDPSTGHSPVIIKDGVKGKYTE